MTEQEQIYNEKLERRKRAFAELGVTEEEFYSFETRLDEILKRYNLTIERYCKCLRSELRARSRRTKEPDWLTRREARRDLGHLLRLPGAKHVSASGPQVIVHYHGADDVDDAKQT